MWINEADEQSALGLAISHFVDRGSFSFLARTAGGAITLPSDRACASVSVFMSPGASLPTTFVGNRHRSHPEVTCPLS